MGKAKALQVPSLAKKTAGERLTGLIPIQRVLMRVRTLKGDFQGRNSMKINLCRIPVVDQVRLQMLLKSCL